MAGQRGAGAAVSSRKRSSSRSASVASVSERSRAAASSTARGRPSNRRQMSLTTGPVRSSAANPGRTARARSTNNSTAAGGARAPTGTSTSPRTPRGSRLVAIRRRPGRAPTSVGHYGGLVDHVLAVVEDDDERLPGEVADDHLHGRCRRAGAAEGGCARPEGAGHRRRHPLGLGDAGQLDQPGTVPVLFAEPAGGLYSQSGLAHPTRADQRHQPAAADRLASSSSSI